MTDQSPSDPKTYDKLNPQPPDAEEDTVDLSTDDKQHEVANDDSVTLLPKVPDRPATVPSNNENQLPHQPSEDHNDDQQQQPNYDHLQSIQQHQPKTVATTEPAAGHKPTDDQQQSGSDDLQPVQQQQYVNFQPQPTDDGDQLPEQPEPWPPDDNIGEEQPPPVYDKLQPAELNPVPVSHDNSTMYTPQAGFVPPAQSGVVVGGYNTTTVTTSPAQVTVYTQQPPIRRNSYLTGDHYLVLSVFNTFCCCIFGGWITLLCTIPAILYSLNAQSAEAAGQFDEMNANERISLNLNMAAIFIYFVLWSLYLIIVVVTVSTTM